ncbi:unnamed protein product [Boreogadus saida]
MLQQHWATTTAGCSSTGPPLHRLHHYTSCSSAPAGRGTSLRSLVRDDEGRKSDWTTRLLPHMKQIQRDQCFAGCSDVEDKLPNFEASRMFFSDGTLSAFRYALLLGVTCLATFFDFTRSSPDVSGYP